MRSGLNCPLITWANNSYKICLNFCLSFCERQDFMLLFISKFIYIFINYLLKSFQLINKPKITYNSFLADLSHNLSELTWSVAIFVMNCAIMRFKDLFHTKSFGGYSSILLLSFLYYRRHSFTHWLVFRIVQY